MKTVFGNSELFHHFGRQGEGHNSKASMSFGGSVAYSYGTAIGQLVGPTDGIRSIVFNDGSYSVTTSKHQRELQQAMTWLDKAYFCPEVPWGIKNLAEYWRDNPKLLREQFNKKIHEAHRARVQWKKENYWHTARNYQAFSVLLGDLFPKKKLQPLPTLEAGISTELFAKVTAEVDKADKLYWANEKRKKTIERKKGLAKLKEWRAGTISTYHLPWDVRKPVMLRVVGDEIETSLGAIVPVKFYWPVRKKIQAVMKRGEYWHRNGKSIHVGVYNVDRIEPNGTVHIGCHEVAYGEIARIECDIPTELTGV